MISRGGGAVRGMSRGRSKTSLDNHDMRGLVSRSKTSLDTNPMGGGPLDIAKNTPNRFGHVKGPGRKTFPKQYSGEYTNLFPKINYGRRHVDNPAGESEQSKKIFGDDHQERRHTRGVKRAPTPCDGLPPLLQNQGGVAQTMPFHRMRHCVKGITEDDYRGDHVVHKHMGHHHLGAPHRHFPPRGSNTLGIHDQMGNGTIGDAPNHGHFRTVKNQGEHSTTEGSHGSNVNGNRSKEFQNTDKLQPLRNLKKFSNAYEKPYATCPGYRGPSRNPATGAKLDFAMAANGGQFHAKMQTESTFAPPGFGALPVLSAGKPSAEIRIHDRMYQSELRHFPQPVAAQLDAYHPARTGSQMAAFGIS